MKMLKVLKKVLAKTFVQTRINATCVETLTNAHCFFMEIIMS